MDMRVIESLEVKYQFKILDILNKNKSNIIKDIYHIVDTKDNLDIIWNGQGNLSTGI